MNTDLLEDLDWTNECAEQLRKLGASDEVISMARHYVAPSSVLIEKQRARGVYELASDLLGNDANKMNDTLYRKLEAIKDEAYRALPDPLA